MRKILQNTFLLLVLLFICTTTNAQISGHVYDSQSKEPLPFCNIICKSTKTGTTTNLDGEFEIEAKLASVLHISFIGYKSKKIKVNNTNLGKIYLEPKSSMIREVRVIMKEDPAVILMRKVINQKEILGPKKVVEGMETQDLFKVYLSDPNQKVPGLKKSKLFVKMTQSMTKGVPFFISDKRFYKDSLISQKDHGVGIEHDFFVDYINSINFNFDVYDDLINIMGRSITSPLSNNAFSFYKFYLLDSVYVNNNYCYKVKITAKRKNDAVFLGNIWIEKNSFVVKKIDVSLANEYVNLLEGFEFAQEFDKKEGINFESSNSIQFTMSTSDLPIISDSISLTINKKTRKYPFKDTKEKKDSILNNEEILSEISIIDSLNNDPRIKLLTKISEIIITSYYTKGKIDIGPIYSMYNSNKIEGIRPSILFRTNKYFKQNLMISNYVGYGTLDKRFKYGFEFKIRDKEEKSLQLTLSYQNHIENMDDKYIYRVLRPNLFQASGNDVFTSIFSGMQEDKMLYFTKTKLSLEKQFGNLDLSTFFTDKRIEKNKNIIANKNIYQSTLGFGFRFSRSKKVKNHFNTYNVKSTAPLFSGVIAFSDKKYFKSDYDIIKAKFIIRQNVNTTFFGRTRYVFDMGYYKISNNTPLMFLEYHRGNESYIYDLTKSSLMNQNEFLSDRYVSLYIDHHFNGRLFNRIPLLNRLEIRETITTNIIYGNLHNSFIKNNLPEFTYALNYGTPYAEVGVGVENIFKLIRINFIWRLTYLDKPESIPFGVIGGIYFSL